jgi:hypothetical protein
MFARRTHKGLPLGSTLSCPPYPYKLCFFLVFFIRSSS